MSFALARGGARLLEGRGGCAPITPTGIGNLAGGNYSSGMYAPNTSFSISTSHSDDRAIVSTVA